MIRCDFDLRVLDIDREMKIMTNYKLRREEWARAGHLMASETLFVGVGKCGGAITNRIQRRGYRAFYINTAFGDFVELERVSDSQLYAIPEAGGCNKDRELAKDLVADNAAEIISIFNSRYPSFKNYFFVFSLGGGTGSGMTPALAKYMAQQGKKVSLIIVLPTRQENRKPSANAYACLAEIEEMMPYLCNVYIVDNEKEESKEEVNEMIADCIDSVLSLTEHVGVTSDRSSFDGLKPCDDTENRALIHTQGVVQVAKLSSSQSGDAQEPYKIEPLSCMAQADDDAPKVCDEMAISIAYAHKDNFQTAQLYQEFGRPSADIKIGLNTSNDSLVYVFGKEIPKSVSERLEQWIVDFDRDAFDISSAPKFTKDFTKESKSVDVSAIKDPFGLSRRTETGNKKFFEKPNPFVDTLSTAPPTNTKNKNKNGKMKQSNPFA